jgi:hypothetical protein
MRTIVVLGAALSCVAPSALAQTAQRYPLAGDNIAIYNLAGTVRVEGGSGGEVMVEVARGGADAGKLDVVTGPLGGRQTLRVIYPDDDIIYRALGGHSSSSLDVRDDGTFNGNHREFGRGHRVRIRGDGSGTEAFADLRIVVPPGKQVAVYLAVGKMTAANVSGDLTLDVSAADVSASGIRGSLVVDAGSGNVRVTDVTGNANLDTGSGNVTVSGVQGDELRIDTGSGDVTLDRAEVRSLNIDTGSGNADATAVKAQDLSISTGSGNVTLVLLDTGSGDIDLGSIPVTVRRIEENHVEGRIGDGRGRLQIETGSGGVRLRKA